MSLRATPELLSGILNASQDGIMGYRTVRDRQGKVVDFEWTLANPVAERSMRRASELLLGRSLLAEFPATRDVGLFDLYVEVADSGRHRSLEYRYDVDGAERWFLSTAVPLEDGITVTFRDITAQKRLQAELEHRAMHDPLTGLPNRLLLKSRARHSLDRLRRSAGQVAIFFVDLDRFKVVNDCLGHEAGDDLLVTVAGRLLGAARPSDTVARFGGDEFVVVCELAASRDAVGVAERLIDAFAAPVSLRDRDVVVEASIGIAMADRSDADIDQLVRDADQAMMRAKASGGGCWRFFDRTSSDGVDERLDVELMLRRAIEGEQLRVHYQPIVECSDPAGPPAIVGAEALVRWEHPERGLIPPGDFIPVAEATGLVVPLGAWVLRQALVQLRRWQDLDPTAAPRTISVNVAAAQLSHGGLATTVFDALDEAGLPPGSLCLEVTESSLMADPETAKYTLDRLSASGVRVALDDFGTGYSSLSFLQRFPVDVVKIDRSFVDGLGSSGNDSALVGAVIALAAALGKSTVAEGVETAVQLAELIRLGGTQMQGYLFARPVSADDFVAVLVDGIGVPAV